MKLIRKIKEVIKGTKFENHTFIAGGWVRDHFMGRVSKDIDFVVDLERGGLDLACFLKDKLKGTSVVVFERFGTAQVVIDEKEIEFVTTRKEVYSNNSRNPEVSFGTLEEDVYRRDFTINSLLYDISSESFLDLTKKGLIDIESRLIRTTSSPSVIFREDPLRIMRGIRFSSQLGFKIEKETKQAIMESVTSLDFISKERIRDEFLKILKSQYFISKGLPLLLETGVMDYILPEFSKTIGMIQGKYHSKDVYGHICDVVSKTKVTPLHKLAALLHDIGKVNTRTETETGVHFYGHEEESFKITERFMKDFKFSTSEIELVTSAVLEHMMLTKKCSDKTLRRKRMELGEDKWEFLLDLCEADRLSHTDSDSSEIERARELTLKEKLIIKDKLPVNGQDVMDLFKIKQGSEVGRILSLIRDRILEDPALTREELLEELFKMQDLPRL